MRSAHAKAAGDNSSDGAENSHVCPEHTTPDRAVGSRQREDERVRLAPQGALQTAWRSGFRCQTCTQPGAADQLRAAGRRGWTGRSGLGPDTRWDSRWGSWGLRPRPCGTRRGCCAGHRGRRPGPCRSGERESRDGGAPRGCRQRSAGPGPDPREGTHPASPEEHARGKQTVPAEVQFQKPVYTQPHHSPRTVSCWYHLFKSHSSLMGL